MPNWCSNRLKVTKADETAEAVDQFNKFIAIFTADGGTGVENRIFNRFVPMPEGYYNDDRWYDWACNNWGTKWDIHDADVTVERSDDEFSAWFDTAWCPPEKFLLTVSEEYNKLTFLSAYSEMGNGMAGFDVYRSGKVVEQYEVLDVGFEPMDDDSGEDDYDTPTAEWQAFMDEHGLHMGG